MGKGQTLYCEECLEDIAPNDVYWEGKRGYCGHCGSELDTESHQADMVDVIQGKIIKPVIYEEGELDEEELDDSDGEDDLEEDFDVDEEGVLGSSDKEDEDDR